MAALVLESWWPRWEEHCRRPPSPTLGLSQCGRIFCWRPQKRASVVPAVWKRRLAQMRMPCGTVMAPADEHCSAPDGRPGRAETMLSLAVTNNICRLSGTSMDAGAINIIIIHCGFPFCRTNHDIFLHFRFVLCLSPLLTDRDPERRGGRSTRTARELHGMRPCTKKQGRVASPAAPPESQYGARTLARHGTSRQRAFSVSAFWHLCTVVDNTTRNTCPWRLTSKLQIHPCDLAACEAAGSSFPTT